MHGLRTMVAGLFILGAFGCSNVPAVSNTPSSAASTAPPPASVPSAASAAVAASPAATEPTGRVLDVSELVAHADRFHDHEVRVRGLVVSMCQQEGCFVDLVPVSGKGPGVVVSGRHSPGHYPADSVGKIATAQGTFYRKIYPRSRMEHWHHHGWRAAESDIPAFATIFRLGADSVEFTDAPTEVAVDETPLAPHESPLLDLASTEFEADGMGTGHKCLRPGESMPAHSTGRYHELILGIEGDVTITMEGRDEALRLTAGHACYVPPKTKHEVVNAGARRACYVFVYAVPEAAKTQPDATKASPKHGH